MTPQDVLLSMFAAFLLAACVWDLRSRRIPNGLVVAFALAGIMVSVALDPWLPGAARAVGGFVLGMVVWAPFVQLRLLGGGDVKLFAAASAWLGPAGVLQAALLSALFGGVLAAIWICKQYIARRASTAAGAPQPVVASTLRGVGAGGTRDRLLPYGLAMAAGLMLTAWQPHLLG